MKNILRLAVGGAVLTGSALLMTPDSAVGYSTIGGSLGTGQRDHRLYDTFTSSGANNNTTTIANMPGYVGAELAIWKGGAEWGARAFGDGSGDTTQSNLGDGGANFNFFWNGDANGIGGANDNIHSPISGSSGGVLAYTETPIADGWRIRYYQSWSWQDGPGTVSSGIDLQGVACHELGHALGLGHSTTGGATMYPSISGTGQAQRSIETDDKNGVKAVYGTLSASMPEITSVTGSLIPGGTVTINGSGFHATNNRIWLDSDVVNGGNSGGEPFIIDNQPSTNGGTKITLTLPGAGGYVAGSIHVKDGSHNNHWAVSEGHPFDVAGGPVTDTILLIADNYFPPAGSQVTFTIGNAIPGATFILHYSFTNTGTTINGQPFDIGPPNGAVASGVINPAGGALITRTVPAGASGRTAYMEVQADWLGVTYDSNMITIVVP
jgi:hypothetical protein